MYNSEKHRQTEGPPNKYGVEQTRMETSPGGGVTKAYTR